MKTFKRLEDFLYILATALITVFMIENLSVNVFVVAICAAFAGFGIKATFQYKHNVK